MKEKKRKKEKKEKEKKEKNQAILKTVKPYPGNSTTYTRTDEDENKQNNE